MLRHTDAGCREMESIRRDDEKEYPGGQRGWRGYCDDLLPALRNDVAAEVGKFRLDEALEVGAERVLSLCHAIEQISAPKIDIQYSICRFQCEQFKHGII